MGLVSAADSTEEDIPIEIIGGLPHGGDSAKILQAIMEEIKRFISRWREDLAKGYRGRSYR